MSCYGVAAQHQLFYNGSSRAERQPNQAVEQAKQQQRKLDINERVDNGNTGIVAVAIQRQVKAHVFECITGDGQQDAPAEPIAQGLPASR